MSNEKRHSIRGITINEAQADNVQSVPYGNVNITQFMPNVKGKHVIVEPDFVTFCDNPSSHILEGTPVMTSVKALLGHHPNHLYCHMMFHFL